MVVKDIHTGCLPFIPRHSQSPPLLFFSLAFYFRSAPTTESLEQAKGKVNIGENSPRRKSRLIFTNVHFALGE